ncbi:MAG: proline/glycine betaine ABC transporter ATP-binding protein, partial [Salinibacter sp.]
FSALDPLIREEMQNELLDLQDQWDPACTILFITHDLDEALKMGDRIAIMKDGELAQVGTPTEILTEPADDYVQSFVQNVDRTKVIPVRTVMRDLRETDQLQEDRSAVSPHTSIAEVLPRVLETDGPVPVRDSAGELQGVVSRKTVMEEISRNANNVSQTREAAREEKAMETA